MRPLEFLSCDWGTSSFRLRRVLNENVVSEIRENVGVKTIYDQSLSTATDRYELFATYLAAKLEEIGGGGAPLIISGMASSTIGWKELPYAKTPFRLDGTGLHVERVEWSGHERTFLVSGVATADDVMRGEETQVLGIMSVQAVADFANDCALILPGTHSKHVRIERGVVTRFRTYMTGELFDLLGRHSILRASVNLDDRQREPEAFLAGVSRSFEFGLAASLFSVRARAVLEKVVAAKNTSYLSGLLIGAELEHLVRALNVPILLAGAGIFSELYSSALSHPACKQLKWWRISSDEVEQATIRAHSMILDKQL